MDRIRVAVVDDDGLIRDGLGAILETHADIEFVGAADDAIVESVRAVHRGTSVLQTEIARRLASTIGRDAPTHGGASAPRGSAPTLGLAPREAEILTLIAEGLSNKEIAGRLNLSDGTVRNYVSEMLVKLDVRDRTQLAILYYRSL